MLSMVVAHQLIIGVVAKQFARFVRFEDLLQEIHVRGDEQLPVRDGDRRVREEPLLAFAKAFSAAVLRLGSSPNCTFGTPTSDASCSTISQITRPSISRFFALGSPFIDFSIALATSSSLPSLT